MNCSANVQNYTQASQHSFHSLRLSMVSTDGVVSTKSKCAGYFEFGECYRLSACMISFDDCTV